MSGRSAQDNATSFIRTIAGWFPIRSEKMTQGPNPRRKIIAHKCQEQPGRVNWGERLGENSAQGSKQLAF
jgi:hypothetical protein